MVGYPSAGSSFRSALKGDMHWPRYGVREATHINKHRSDVTYITKCKKTKALSRNMDVVGSVWVLRELAAESYKIAAIFQRLTVSILWKCSGHATVV